MYGLLALLLVSPADAAKIKVASATASSVYPPEEGVTYDAKRVHDGRQQTSWVEGEDGSGLGSWLEFDLGGDKKVKKIKVWGGLWYSWDYYNRANRPKELEFTFSDGSTQKFTLADEMVPQVFELKKAKTTSTVKVKVNAIHSGNTWLDTGISEIQFFDDQPDTRVAPKGFKSSSELPADDDGSYVGKNVADGISDSMWCEADEGDGTDQWLELDFGASKSISQVEIINGIGTGLGIYMKGNRATGATLQFSDGSTEDVTFKPLSVYPQSVSFPAHTTSKVKMTFTGIAKGKEYNDLCISELHFSK